MSVQDMIKKSVLESGVFDSFNAPKMAISLIIALLLGAVIYMVYSKFHLVWSERCLSFVSVQR